MNFRLIYRGPLHPQGGGSANPRHKHFIRQQFHLQLSVLWKSVPFINSIGEINVHWQKPDGSHELVSRIEKMAREHSKGGFRFVPLISKELGLACRLKVLILRREEPGQQFGGDIDNRFKVLVDALKIPDESDIRGMDPSDDDDPFFCLLEDDARLTDFQVKSDRLLIPDDFPMSHQIIMDAAGSLYDRIRHGEIIANRAAWDNELEQQIDRECERRRADKEIVLIVKVIPLIADPSVAYSDFAY